MRASQQAFYYDYFAMHKNLDFILFGNSSDNPENILPILKYPSPSAPRLGSRQSSRNARLKLSVKGEIR
jgi:hypothetical protein